LTGSIWNEAVNKQLVQAEEFPAADSSSSTLVSQVFSMSASTFFS